MLPDLVLSGLLVIGELLRVAAAGPEAAQARRTEINAHVRVHVPMCL